MDFQEKLREFFLNQFKDGMDQSKFFIAFEPIGCMIDELDPADPQSKTKANEQLSILAERLPAIQESMSFGTSRFTDLLETLVYGSAFREDLFEESEKGDYKKIFNRAKAEALAKLEQGKRASVVTATGSYFLVTGQPEAWYNKNAAIWTSKSFSQKFTEQSASEEKPMRLDLQWKRIDQSRITSPLQNKFEGLIKHRLVSDKPIVKEFQVKFPLQRSNSNFQQMKLQHVRSNRINMPVEPTQRMDLKLQHLPPILSKRIELIHMLKKDDLLVQQPSQADGFELSFDYCLVNLQRDWFDRSLLHYAKLWYAKALEKDFFSNGMKDNTNRGELKCITTAMILVKNLKIVAKWSQQDKVNAGDSISLGFFNVADSEINSKNELINPGIQALGWICEVFPALPIVSDPKLT
ncbi:hypothetical protein GQF61_05800 [Sphingobacterium sp. DK4209]|uniref:Uncharacterized protein n=2 Tax=Sphingobacterium zhuxiongii TaxID=2662364 RepID=A0A5Q0Q927_9SPHI|nr:hypothetical protein [Sphingobacterium sp. dk4302]MVZ65361.1 hypothetical protein [Sphingobacterium sp. DK4209]QGA26445.1 hypothetical protein GFH32_08940 [Sphingobacterium sp. dk4302]